jgi:Protein of unknown function (DUF1549)/Protein of unknown function (DUF1553)
MKPPTRLLAVIAIAVASGPAAAEPLMSRLIDEQINARLRADGVAPAGRADDATLVRRIYLDLLGRSPSAAEAESFLDDPAKDKVHCLIDQLRLYPETAAHWRRVVAGWLQAGNQTSGELPLLNYLALSVGFNRGWDWVARDLLNPTESDPRLRGAAEYLAHFVEEADAKAGREAATVAVASAFFGVQLQCARCHDHPTVPAWTKAHFDGLRAFFDRTETSRKDSALKLTEKPFRLTDTRPMFLDGKKFALSNSPRTELAAYAFRPEARHFKQAVVNRVWKQFMGRGLVEPVDMIHDENPASHPMLFTKLADDFAGNQFNFDRLISSIMHSEAYLRSSRWTVQANSRPAAELFAVAPLRPLSGAQMAWSVAVATGYVRASDIDPRLDGGFLPLGKGFPITLRFRWEAIADFAKLADIFREGAAASTASHAIYLAFDPFMSSVLDAKNGRLVATLVNEPDDQAMARLVYLAILNRRPTQVEIDQVKEHMKTAKSRSAGCQDVAWALIAGAEFRFNH